MEKQKPLKYGCYRNKWLLYCMILIAFGCSKYNRRESVKSRLIVEELNDESKQIFKKYYQEFDKNDSLIYQVEYGRGFANPKNPNSIKNRYFSNGKLIREVITGPLLKKPFVTNIIYKDQLRIDDFGTGAFRYYWYDAQNRLIKEEDITHNQIQSSKYYIYVAGSRVPNVKVYWRNKFWSFEQNICKGDTCLTFIEDSSHAIVQMSLSVYHLNKLVVEYFNDPLPPGFNHPDTSDHSIKQFKNRIINSYDSNGKIMIKRTYYQGRLFSTVRYIWDQR